MRILKELLPGAFLLELSRSEDTRGFFVKTYAESLLRKVGIAFELKEEFYSTSRNNVVRGMHFQVPPHAHDKLIYCLAGEVNDVLVDLRGGAEFGRVASTVLREGEPRLLFVPKGIAHGFHSRRDGSLMVYKTSSEYAPDADRGVRWDSIGFDWGLEDPVLSSRDASFPALQDSPRVFG